MSVTLQCPECGKQYTGKARFCRADGARLVEAEPATATGTTPSAASAVSSVADETPADPTTVNVAPPPSAVPLQVHEWDSGPVPTEGSTSQSTADSRSGPVAQGRAAGGAASSTRDPRRASSRDLRSLGLGLARSSASRGPSGHSSGMLSADSLGLPGAISGEYRRNKLNMAAISTISTRDDPRRESGRDHSGLLAKQALAQGLKSPASDGSFDHRMDPRMDPMIGRVIAGRFLIEKMLGSGATGVVYRAKHRALGRTMAVKLLKQQFVWDDRSLERFFREARTYSMLDHPNIVYLYDFGRGEHGEPFLVMEFAEGETLHEAIQQSETRTLPMDRVLNVLCQVARALDHAHSRGVIHRDIKPENIMLCRQDTQDDLVKLLDFGVARLVDQSRVTGVGQVTGTAEFIAPETLLDDGLISSAVDMYALGMIFHDAVVGRTPFTGTLDVVLHQHLEVVPPLLSERSGDPGIPEELDYLVASLLEKDPAHRPLARDVADTLERMLEEWLGREFAVDDASSLSGSGFDAAALSGAMPSALSGRAVTAPSGSSMPSRASIPARASIPPRASVASRASIPPAAAAEDATQSDAAAPVADMSDLDTQRLQVTQRPTIVVTKADRKTEISDRLARPTQVVDRQAWPTLLLTQAEAPGGLVSKPTQVLPSRTAGIVTQEQLDALETQSSALIDAANNLAMRLWPGGWPQALLNLQQHIASCDEQERKLTNEIDTFERKRRERPAILERHNALRMKVMHLSERLRNEGQLEANARMRLIDELEVAERAFFALESTIEPPRRGNTEAQRQSRLDVRATRRRSRVMFVRLLMAMPCPAQFEAERRTVADLLSQCDTQASQISMR